MEIDKLLLSFVALSGTIFFLKDFLIKVFDKISSFFIYKLDIFYSDSDYTMYNEWLTTIESNLVFKRNYRLINGKKTIGYGYSLLKLKGFPFILINRYKDNSKTAIYEQTDCITFYFFKNNAETNIEKLINKIKEDTNKKMKNNLYESRDGWWLNVGMPKEVLEPVDKNSHIFLNDLNNFLNNKHLYLDKGLSYKRGYVLHGSPGTGKTSLICYASKKYNIPIYSVNTKITTELLSKINNKPAFLIIEDIDMSIYGSKREELDTESGILDDVIYKKNNQPEVTKSNSVESAIKSFSLREFLNVLDGIQSIDGIIFIFTTNNIDALDKALLRPGRIDKIIEMKPLDVKEQKLFIKQSGCDINVETDLITTAELQLKITESQF